MHLIKTFARANHDHDNLNIDPDLVEGFNSILGTTVSSRLSGTGRPTAFAPSTNSPTINHPPNNSNHNHSTNNNHGHSNNNNHSNTYYDRRGRNYYYDNYIYSRWDPRYWWYDNYYQTPIVISNIPVQQDEQTQKPTSSDSNILDNTTLLMIMIFILLIIFIIKHKSN